MDSYDSVIEMTVYDHLNSWPDKPCVIGMQFPKRRPISFSMSMQQLSGTVYLRRYVNGSFVGAWPFAVLVRFAEADDSKRFQASGILNSLNEWLRSAELPSLGEERTANYFEMTALPSCVAQYEDGSADYQAVYQLVYKKKGCV
ncbi:MAG: hypothetical protein J6A79_07840 [Clostridia bacterium]|nr:hypothetical protein [Clostridia bacterium]